MLGQQSIAFSRLLQLGRALLDASLELDVRRREHRFLLLSARHVPERDGNRVVRSDGGDCHPPRITSQIELDLVAIELTALGETGERL